MGYTTYFTGEFTINKPVDKDTFKLLDGITNTRRMKRDPKKLAKRLGITEKKCKELYGEECEFWIGDTQHFGQEDTADITDYNKPPKSQPGLWCQWQIKKDRQTIIWNDAEKFYNYIEWIEYLINKILKPKGYVVNGIVFWRGEESEDMGEIHVKDNAVSVKRAEIFMLSDEDAVRVRKFMNNYLTNPLKECIDEVVDNSE